MWPFKSEKRSPKINTNINELKIYSIKLSKKNFVALVIEFTGEYGIGSRGNEDSCFMIDVIKLAVNSWITSGLILDFTNFIYRWGNNIEDVFWAAKLEREVDFPTIVVTSELSRDYLNKLKPFSQISGEEKWLYNDIKSALIRMEQIFTNR